MERYIEVIGEGEFVETAARFVADILLEVRAAKDETGVRDLAELWSSALAALRDGGVRDDEMIEGGTDIYRPWYWKKKVGQNVTRKIRLKVAEFSRLNRALDRLEPLQSRHADRKTISIDMRQPEFEDSYDARSLVLARAYEDARAKGIRLANVMNCAIGEPIRVEEGGWTKRNSGFSGEEDGEGDSSRSGWGGFAAAGGAGDGVLMASAPEEELQRPSRTIFVKCRVRFSISSAP